jgi:serine/threonine protein kinase
MGASGCRALAGSLQTRLDLKPRDVAYLKAMGHFQAAPKPLTWRQRLRVVLQALEALIYLHTRVPRVLHRDFKPANILLDASLNSFLGDTGFAKAAQREGDASKLHHTTTGRVMGSPGYAHKDVLSGQYNETTEGYAVGVTLLVILTNRDPVDIEDEIEKDHDETPFADIPAVQMAEAGAGWTVEAASTIKELYHGLCVVVMPVASGTQTAY